MEPIILASGSLRRQEYFKLLNLPFSIMPASIDENYDNRMEPRAVAETLATRKVAQILDQLKDRVPPWICGADTLLAVDHDIIGKPRDREDAKQTIMRLQGCDHKVITAVALFNGTTRLTDCRSVVSTVSFAALSDDEIEWYLNTGEWQGVAGSYRIQGLASCYISKITGSYSAIVGLPLHEFYLMLRENGYPYAVN
ncbi:Maf-like protein YceF [Spirochaetia bacterium]|nr:Maf-like protein YceF [Spirochaetia bacterium]GHU31898.1 Maf-like protein YceF [Spirochaetia bacterium]